MAQHSPAGAARAGAAPNWYEAFQQRLATIPEGEPVLLVAASGGGSRAAIFGGLTLEALARLRCGSRAEDNWGKHVALISSVSGGSLATAHYVCRQGPTFPERRSHLLHSPTAEMVGVMQRLAPEIQKTHQEIDESLTASATPAERAVAARRDEADQATRDFCDRLATHEKLRPDDPAWALSR